MITFIINILLCGLIDIISANFQVPRQATRGHCRQGSTTPYPSRTMQTYEVEINCKLCVCVCQGHPTKLMDGLFNYLLDGGWKGKIENTCGKKSSCHNWELKQVH